MVSIITPVYNVSAFIARYMESVMAQTYTDLEVLLVDDHGTDDSIQKARDIAEAYSGPIRFRFLSTPVNGGPGLARNVGISEAKGDYLVFVDSDDTIEPDYCRLLYESAVRNDSDLVCCNLCIRGMDGGLILECRNPKITDGPFVGDAKKSFLCSFVSFFWSFMYKRDLFVHRGLKFPNGRSSEDSVMLSCALFLCQRISQVDVFLYNYYRNCESLTMSIDPERYKSKVSMLNFLVNTSRENGWYEDYKDEVDFIYFKKGYVISLFTYVANVDRIKVSVFRDVTRQMKELIPDYLKCSYIWKNPVWIGIVFMINFFPRLLSVAIRAYLSMHKEIVL